MADATNVSRPATTTARGECPFCKKKFVASHLASHVAKQHTGACPVRCERSGCDEYFADERAMRRHVALFHDQTHKCATCGKAFSTKQMKERHEHSPTRPRRRFRARLRDATSCSRRQQASTSTFGERTRTRSRTRARFPDAVPPSARVRTGIVITGRTFTKTLEAYLARSTNTSRWHRRRGSARGRWSWRSWLIPQPFPVGCFATTCNNKLCVSFQQNLLFQTEVPVIRLLELKFSRYLSTGEPSRVQRLLRARR